MEQAAQPIEQAAVASAPQARLTLPALVSALRPGEWIKNSFVFAAVLFSGRFDATTALRSAGAFAAFCAVASAGYVVNDIHDVDVDRRHPVKRNRAIASGALSLSAAWTVAAVLLVAGLAIALVVSPAVCGLVAAYGGLTLAYSVGLKRLVIIDVMTIAGCFLLRVVTGAVAIDVPASSWLLVCTGMVSMFLGFTKRRQEAVLEKTAPFGARPVLEHYSLPFLDQMVAMVSAGTILSYTIYATQSPRAGNQMLWTVPMVVYGIFRYLYLIYHREEVGSTADLITRDPGIIGAAVAWAGAAALVVYL
jgi:4-hydroxybenzoate polyprenyltransferase